MSQRNWLILAVAAAVLFYLVKTGKLGAHPATGRGDGSTIPPNPGRAGSGIDTSAARTLRNTTVEVNQAANDVNGGLAAATGGLGALLSGVGDIFSRVMGRTGRPNPVTSGSGAGVPVSNRNLGPIADNPDGNTSLDPSTADSSTNPLDEGGPADYTTTIPDQWDATSPESMSYFDSTTANP